MTLEALLDRDGLNMADVAGHLDELGAAARAAECLSLSPSKQKRLWEAASASPHISGQLLSRGPEGVTTTYLGRNSLALFSRFEKRFAGEGDGVFGYNRHPLGWLIGPGYFAVTDPSSPKLSFDYSRLPDRAPEGWPALKANTTFFARPVYGGLNDQVVWVSRDVLIGAAFRTGAPLDSYFVLTRAPR